MKQNKKTVMIIGCIITICTFIAAVLIGCEPTGHYWFAFVKNVNDHQKRLVMVNLFSVKKIKELDDNSP